MEFKGTKGVWKVVHEINVMNSCNRSVCACGTINHSEKDSMLINKANAQLIATAPELLKELTKIKFDIDMGVINVRRDSPIYKGIINVIKKATTI